MAKARIYPRKLDEVKHLLAATQNPFSKFNTAHEKCKAKLAEEKAKRDAALKAAPSRAAAAALKEHVDRQYREARQQILEAFKADLDLSELESSFDLATSAESLYDIAPAVLQGRHMGHPVRSAAFQEGQALGVMAIKTMAESCLASKHDKASEPVAAAIVGLLDNLSTKEKEVIGFTSKAFAEEFLADEIREAKAACAEIKAIYSTARGLRVEFQDDGISGVTNITAAAATDKIARGLRAKATEKESA